MVTVTLKVQAHAHTQASGFRDGLILHTCEREAHTQALGFIGFRIQASEMGLFYIRVNVKALKPLAVSQSGRQTPLHGMIRIKICPPLRLRYKSRLTLTLRPQASGFRLQGLAYSQAHHGTSKRGRSP